MGGNEIVWIYLMWDYIKGNKVEKMDQVGTPCIEQLGF